MSYIIAIPSVCPSNPHPWIGNDMGGCAYRFTTYRESDFADHDGQFGSPLHHPGFLKSGVGGSTGICPFIGLESQ